MRRREDGLTKPSLFHVLCCEGKRRKQFDHDPHYNHSHRLRQRDLGIDIKASEKVFGRFEKVFKRIIACANFFDRLSHVTVDIERNRTDRYDCTYREENTDARKNRLCGWERLQNKGRESLYTE